MWLLRAYPALWARSWLASPAGLPGPSPLKCPRIGEDGTHRVSLLDDPGGPLAGVGGPDLTAQLGAKRRGRTRESPDVWFSRGFTRPPGPRLATTPTEPPTSKPVVPGCV